jgi:hypothetical protein
LRKKGFFIESITTMGYRSQEEPSSLIYRIHMNHRWLGMEKPNVAKQIFAKGRVCSRYLIKGSRFIII